MKQRITLGDFQNSNGIELQDQILLLNNPDAFDEYCHTFKDFRRQPGKQKKGLLRRLQHFLDRKLDLETVLPGDAGAKLFLGYHYRSFDQLKHLQSLFEKIRRQPKKKFIVLIGKGDYDFDNSWSSRIPENVLGIAANNADLEDPRVQYMPMGRDFRSKEVFPQFPPCAEKSIVAYCNFSVSTHPVRQTVYDLLKKKDFVKFEHMGSFKSYSLSREEFFERLSASKFCICPRGNAIDTFRMWDSMYVGTIPIVVREARYHDELSDLPILFLDSYDEFSELSQSYLDNKYEEMKSTLFNYEKLKLDYWKGRLESRLDPNSDQPQTLRIHSADVSH